MIQQARPSQELTLVDNSYKIGYKQENRVKYADFIRLYSFWWLIYKIINIWQKLYRALRVLKRYLGL